MDFSHYYHTRIRTTLDEDRAAIGAGFQDILQRGLRVSCRLVSYYKGLPISYPATLVEINRGTLELDVHQQQAFAIDASRVVFIKCDYFDCAILAEVQNSNVRKMTAALKNFTFVEIMAERREALRLQLGTPTDAEIISGALKLSGQLCDLSLGGFSILTAGRCTLANAVEVLLRVQIPNLIQNTLTTLETGACHYATGSSHKICRFSFQADAQSEAVISRFIFQRQVDLIREIKDAL